MKLYKNVDIKDLESILEKGILSLDESENNNWDYRKRASNRTDVVYLFNPIIERSVFPKYGVVLLECEVDAVVNEIDILDSNNGKYEEYIIEKVAPEQITRVYIPEIFKGGIELPEVVINKITWCNIAAEHYSDKGIVEIDDKTLEQFAKTAPINNSQSFNFFRGVTEKNTMIDLYNVKYL